MKRFALTTLALLAACVNSQTGENETISGTFQATIFTVTPTGQGLIDVIAAGGSLRITISESGATTGQLSLPASVTGGAAFNASMEGTAVITGLTVRFTQSADTFVRDLIWSRQSAQLLIVDNQAAGSATYTIALVRQ